LNASSCSSNRAPRSAVPNKKSPLREGETQWRCADHDAAPLCARRLMTRAGAPRTRSGGQGPRSSSTSVPQSARQRRAAMA
jgi:hypothetical protein